LDEGYDNRPTRELVEGRNYVPTSDGSARRSSTGPARSASGAAVGRRARVGLAFEVSLYPGALREEGIELPGDDRGGMPLT
jgi:hypothetical protein